MAKSSVAAQTLALCTPVVEELGYELIDVEFQREEGSWFLRLIIDRKGGISLDDCTAVSQRVDPLIDENIPIDKAYYLEVSSPGLDRPLKTEADFRRYEGQEVEVTLYQARDGVKRFQGKILGMDGNVLEIEDAQGVKHSFGKEERAKVKRVIHF